MVAIKNQLRRTSGFALIVVLSTLAILTLLFAISTRLSLAHIQAQDTELALAGRSHLNVTLLRAASAPLSETRQGGPLQVTVGEVTYTLRATDVGGLVDLNTAQPPLLQAYLTAIGLTDEEITRFRTWRQTSKRLLRVQDLIRVSEAANADRALLLATATVHSGRTGIARDEAPEALTDLLAADWQDTWETAASGVRYQIHYSNGSARIRLGEMQIQLANDSSIVSVD